MAEINLEINKRLDILWYDKIYKSSVQDMSDNYIAIAAPILGGVYLPLHKGDTFEVIYYIDEKQVYEFTGNVVGRKFEEKVQLIILEFPKEWKLVQRREFVRIEVSNPIRYVKFVTSDDLKLAEKTLDEETGTTGILMDLSGGGLRIKTTEKMVYGDLIAIDIDLMDRKIRVNGKLVRVFKDTKDNKEYYVCGVAFIELHERTRDKIIQLIFEIMRKQMKTL